ncbi:hypothetical protein LTR50_002973 [Elasticomyces elasticus]|nr:hypothetical protein LTR50_002973 [Elasticomyces elasticus]
MSAISALKATIRRKLSMNDKQANFEEHDDVDEETAAHLQKEIDEAEKAGHDQGRPGSFLNRLISHGNLKTEMELRKELEQQEKKRQSATS